MKDNKELASSLIHKSERLHVNDFSILRNGLGLGKLVTPITVTSNEKIRENKKKEERRKRKNRKMKKLRL